MMFLEISKYCQGCARHITDYVKINVSRIFVDEYVLVKPLIGVRFYNKILSVLIIQLFIHSDIYS